MDDECIPSGLGEECLWRGHCWPYIDLSPHPLAFILLVNLEDHLVYLNVQEQEFGLLCIILEALSPLSLHRAQATPITAWSRRIAAGISWQCLTVHKAYRLFESSAETSLHQHPKLWNSCKVKIRSISRFCRGFLSNGQTTRRNTDDRPRNPTNL